MALFKSKILPIQTYGIEVIWTQLNERNLSRGIFEYGLVWELG
jgi:hypothetical protein